MSLSVNGVWAVGVWDQTVWADGVWREGAPSVSGGTYNIASYFPTGSTVSIELFAAPSWTSVALDTSTCTEIGSTGVFFWDIANVTTLPTAYTEYAYKMTDGTLYNAGIKEINTTAISSNINKDNFLVEFLIHNEIFN